MTGTAPIRFGLIRPSRLPDDFLEWLQASERAGSSLLGFGDSQTMWPDPYIGLTLAAEHTRTSLIGTWVTVPVTRHPTVAASSIAAVQQLSKGRTFFGIGPGDSALTNLGMISVPMAEFEEYAIAVRDLCAHRPVTYRGQALAMHWDTPPVPLWVAGDGPKMLELAGRIGDGVIVGNGGTPGLVEFARRHIAIGAEAAGRSIDDIEIWFMVRVHVAPTVADGITDLSFYLASYANVRFRRSMRDKGVEVTDELAARIAGFRGEFKPDMAYTNANDYNVRLLDKYGLTDWLADQFLVTGPPDHVAARLRELSAAGVRNFAVPQMLPDVFTTTRQVGEVFAALV
jgi:5,10-methylenetetrahydromethanopterin reductase